MSCAEGACASTVSGRLHVVWNGHPRYFLVDEEGGSLELLVDEAAANGYGGWLALDRRQVTVSGERVAQGIVRVQSVHAEGPGGSR